MARHRVPSAWEIEELDAWEIEQLERMRRIHESEAGERAELPLYPPMGPLQPRRDAGEPESGRRVIVLQIC